MFTTSFISFTIVLLFILGSEVRELPKLSSGSVSVGKSIPEQENWSLSVLELAGRIGQSTN